MEAVLGMNGAGCIKSLLDWKKNGTIDEEEFLKTIVASMINHAASFAVVTFGAPLIFSGWPTVFALIGSVSLSCLLNKILSPLTKWLLNRFLEFLNKCGAFMTDNCHRLNVYELE